MPWLVFNRPPSCVGGTVAAKPDDRAAGERPNRRGPAHGCSRPTQCSSKKRPKTPLNLPVNQATAYQRARIESTAICSNVFGYGRIMRELHEKRSLRVLTPTVRPTHLLTGEPIIGRTFSDFGTEQAGAGQRRALRGLLAEDHAYAAAARGGTQSALRGRTHGGRRAAASPGQTGGRGEPGAAASPGGIARCRRESRGSGGRRYRVAAEVSERIRASRSMEPVIFTVMREKETNACGARKRQTVIAAEWRRARRFLPVRWLTERGDATRFVPTFRSSHQTMRSKFDLRAERRRLRSRGSAVRSGSTGNHVVPRPNLC